MFPLKYFFELKDLIIFQKIDNILLDYFSSYKTNDRSRLRLELESPDYYNSHREKIGRLHQWELWAMIINHWSVPCQKYSLLLKNDFYTEHIICYGTSFLLI